MPMGTQSGSFKGKSIKDIQAELKAQGIKSEAISASVDENNSLRQIEGFRVVMRTKCNTVYPELKTLFKKLDDFLLDFENVIRSVNKVRVETRHIAKPNRNKDKPWSER